MISVNVSALRRPIAQPGTPVIFAGRELISRAIAMRTCSWEQLFRRIWASHVGVVFALDQELLLCESTTLDDEPCCIKGKRIKGVQAHPLAERIKHYDGRVWICTPRWSLAEVLEERSDYLTSLVLEKLGTKYDAVGALVTGIDPWKSTYHFSPHRFFCSELVAWLLDRVGAPPVSKILRPGLVTPAEIAREAPERGFSSLLEVL